MDADQETMSAITATMRSGLPRTVSSLLTALLLEVCIPPSWEGEMSMRDIGFTVGYSARTMRRALRDAEALGIIETTPVPWGISRYKVDVQILRRLAEQHSASLGERQSRD